MMAIEQSVKIVPHTAPSKQRRHETNNFKVKVISFKAGARYHESTAELLNSHGSIHTLQLFDGKETDTLKLGIDFVHIN